jgi:hypothetical protein
MFVCWRSDVGTSVAKAQTLLAPAAAGAAAVCDFGIDVQCALKRASMQRAGANQSNCCC